MTSSKQDVGDCALRDFAQRLSDEALRYGTKAKAAGGIDGLVDVAVGEALMRAAHMARQTAIAMEAQRGATPKSDATAEGGDSAGPQDIAQKGSQ